MAAHNCKPEKANESDGFSHTACFATTSSGEPCANGLVTCNSPSGKLLCAVHWRVHCKEKNWMPIICSWANAELDSQGVTLKERLKMNWRELTDCLDDKNIDHRSSFNHDIWDYERHELMRGADIDSDDDGGSFVAVSDEEESDDDDSDEGPDDDEDDGGDVDEDSDEDGDEDSDEDYEDGDEDYEDGDEEHEDGDEDDSGDEDLMVSPFSAAGAAAPAAPTALVMQRRGRKRHASRQCASFGKRRAVAQCDDDHALF